MEVRSTPRARTLSRAGFVLSRSLACVALATVLSFGQAQQYSTDGRFYKPFPGAIWLRTGTSTTGPGGTAIAAGTRTTLATLSRQQIAANAAGNVITTTARVVTRTGAGYFLPLMVGSLVVVSATQWYIDWAERQAELPASLQPGPTPTNWPTAFVMYGAWKTGYEGPGNRDAVMATYGNFPAIFANSYSATNHVMYHVNMTLVRRSAAGNLSGMLSVTYNIEPPYQCASTCSESQAHPFYTQAAKYYEAQAVQRWADQNGVSGGAVDVAHALQTDPAAQDFARQHAMPAHATQTVPDSSVPNTWADPFPGSGVTYPDAPFSPNWNTWMDDPFTVPPHLGPGYGIDTDRDGWPDWIEERLRPGAPWLDPISQPNPRGDPDGDGYTNEQERDALTDPLDPNDKPGSETLPDANPDAPPEREDLQQVEQAIDDLRRSLEAMLADVSTEPRQLEQIALMQDHLTVLEAVRDILAETAGEPDAPVFGELVLPELDYGALGTWSATDTAVAPDVAPLELALEQAVEGLRATAASRAPFAYVEWLPATLPEASGTCPTFDLAFPFGAQQTWNFCDSPMDVWLAGTGRQIAVVFLTFFFVLGIVRRGAE